MRRVTLNFLIVLLAVANAAEAHIGSPDIYLDSHAGPYNVFVTIRPPLVIPGVAEIELRAAAPGIQSMRAVPLPMSGPGAKFAPIPDELTVSPVDPQIFTGSLWMMAPGSWQVRITVEGARGPGSMAVPVPSAALGIKRMQFGLGAILAVLGLLLTGALVAMAGASVREAKLDPGMTPNPQRIRAGRVAMGVALVIAIAALWGGNRWWSAEAASYGAEVYKPLDMRAQLSSPGLLTLNLKDPGWLDGPGWQSLFMRSVDDLIPDHNHLMHLYLIREPGLDLVYHLHPRLDGPGLFRLNLPGAPAGQYRLYADIVHANGFPETLVSPLQIRAAVKGRTLTGDDALGTGTPCNQASATTTEFTLPDQYRMTWLSPPTVLRAKQPVLFRFQLRRPEGESPDDMALYMGMLGHAAFVKTDGTVFAHIHPTGSVSMAAFMLAQQKSSEARDVAGMEMSGMSHAPSTGGALPNEVSFPYGFPSPGHYRIFVQMKHGETIETGIFDAFVT